MSQNREIASVPIVVPIRMLFELKHIESALEKRDIVDLTKSPNKMKHRVGFILSFKKSRNCLRKKANAC